MEDAKTNTATSRSAETRQPQERGGRRRRWESMGAADVRFFLLKPGSSAERPELGREVTSEGEALVEAFKNNQPFVTVVAWKATHEFDGEETKIVKQVMARGVQPRP